MNRSDSIRRDRSYDSVLNRLMRITRSQNQESFKAAMYNFLIAAGIGAFIAVCFILGPFVRPLLWAFLMGAVLFPFKRRLAQLLNGWFERLEERDSNVFVSVCLGPLEATEYCGRVFVSWLYENWQLLSAGAGVITSVKFLYSYAPNGFMCALWRMVVFSHTTFVYAIGLLNIYLLITIIVMYIAAVHFLWKPESSSKFVIAGQTLWIAVVCYACSFFGALQVPFFLLIMLYVGASILYYFSYSNEEAEAPSNLVQNFKKLLNKNDFEKAISNMHQRVYNKKDNNLPSDVEDISLSEPMDSVDTAGDQEENNLSDAYFKFLFYACVITFLYRNLWMLILAAIPVSLHLMTTLGNVTGLTDYITQKISNLYENIRKWSMEHHSAVLPLCLPGVLELNYKINTMIRNSLKSSVDLVTSILMIILMLLIIVFLGVFFCVNIYSETIEVAYLGKDLINKTITDRPELVDILPANIQSSIDDALDNAHHYGRRKIETYIDDWLADADTVHATKLKNQILDVWDRLIQYWIDFNKSESSYGPRVPTEALKSTFGEIVDNPGHFKELVLVAKQGIIGWAKSNTQTILEVAESLWHIIRTNLSLIMSFTGEILSLVLSGGQACVEFILDMIVFFSALFYLLSSSNTKYAPLHITKYMGVSSSGSKIADTLENSISGVLISMFKCSIFTGLFTWFVHTIFGARIVFLPSAIAAVLSAAPFLGSYWCSLPAFLELWLAQDRFYAGVVLFLCQFFIPPYFEAAIYSEMKAGGHPYLTGLAIAGGMYWIGWQGAILGPLMVCFFIGLFEVGCVAMRSNSEQRRSSEDDTRTTKKEVKTDASVMNPNKSSSAKKRLASVEKEIRDTKDVELRSEAMLFKNLEDLINSDLKFLNKTNSEVEIQQAKNNVIECLKEKDDELLHDLNKAKTECEQISMGIQPLESIEGKRCSSTSGIDESISKLEKAFNETIETLNSPKAAPSRVVQFKIVQTTLTPANDSNESVA